MIRASGCLAALCFTCLFPLQVLAQAPVVDDSENFAILDEQQVVHEPPVAKAQIDYADTDEEIALAQDNGTETRDSTMELLGKLKAMQQEIQELRGQVEVQSHDMKLLQQQQLAFYKDIDTRLSSTPSVKTVQATPHATPTADPAPTLASVKPATGSSAASSSAVVTAPMVATSRSNNPADEQIAYLAAYDLVKNKQYEDALSAMQTFVSRYPKGGYTANAQYWLGELHMVKKNYPEAIQHFEIVLKNFSSSSKAAACSLKIGYALAASGKKDEAKQRLRQVMKNYPDTPTAQLASAKLFTINAS